jgi:hypothetical protein
MKTLTAEIVRKRIEVRSNSLAIRKPASGLRKHSDANVLLNWLAVAIYAVLAVGVVWRFYVIENYSNQAEPLAWFDGTNAGPSMAIMLFAAILSVHFIVKAHFDLKQNAAELTEEFGLRNLEEVRPRTYIAGKINVVALWERYLHSGRFLRRCFRAMPMLVLYIVAIIVILPLIGDFPLTIIRGDFPFQELMGCMIFAFLFLTFFVIDAILLHEGFLIQFETKETRWPDATFQNFHYPIGPDRPRSNESDLADYWDILLISKRTEAVGSVIYYPFVILSLLIVARLRCLYNWAWSPALIVALLMHFSLAMYAAWRLPKGAREYRDKILERMKRRRRQSLILAKKTPEAIDTMIEEVQSTHQGAFSYLWEQPAIRALLLPSGGIGLATLLQYLPH